MFCPNCAAKNEDDVRFCRGCGQDISLIARSLKGHSAVVLASEIDKLFDRRNEGILMQSIVLFFFGLIMMLLTLSTL